ncbi:carboxylating nicotinate-nucleotide diphosphorylase [Paludisphaera sp.]|uniref:carboxylating nicotinate-nucleotide diphosphorylase n=1 Tax=Paludisphaera sp. TaxID=2017432 RepID=UPI00301E538B
MPPPEPGFGDAERANARELIRMAIAEDLGDAGDITSRSIIPEGARGSARLVARTPGILSGLPVVAMLLEEFGVPGWRPRKADGDALRAGDLVAEIEGDYRSILALERTALDFVQRLSGVATLTARFVAEVEGTRAKVLDTRKTTPGWRMLEKYAVRCGGGSNHRIGLYDAVLIKDNHLAWLAATGEGDAIARAIAAARAAVPPGTVVEVEVDTLDQLDVALAHGPDIILVDNLGPDALAEAVRRRDARAPGVLLESSGGITLDTIAARARAGVDRISVGALTHSAVALDVAFDASFEAP